MTMSNRKFSNKFTLIVGALGLFLAHSMNAASMADVKAFGAKGDTNVILDASVDKGSNILATHSYQFTPADIGKRIIVVGAGVSGSNLVTDISSVLDPNDVTLRAMAFSAVSEANAYWGTDDSVAIAKALRSISTTGGTLFFPIGTYLNQSRILLPSSITMQGQGHDSWILGDPGATPLVQASNAHNVNITFMRLSNLHTKLGKEYGYDTVLLSRVTDSTISNAWITSGRPAIELSQVARVIINNNTIDAAKDFAITASMSTDIQVLKNVITYSVTTGILGPPHDINLEDTDNSTVDGNRITDGTGFVEAGSSCLQLYPNHNRSVSNDKVTNNICYKETPGTMYGFVGAGPGAYNNVSFSHNQLTGYQHGFWLSGEPSNALIGLVIDGNTLLDTLGYGIGVGGMDGESVADVHIVNNKITMHNQFQGSLYGIYVNRLQHVIIAGNSVSNFGKGGIQLLAVSYSTVFSNQVFNNGRSSKGAGIQLLQWNSSMGSSFNVVQNNSVYDDQSTPTQVTSIQITTGAQTNNRVVGNTSPIH